MFCGSLNAKRNKDTSFPFSASGVSKQIATPRMELLVGRSSPYVPSPSEPGGVSNSTTRSFK